MTAWLVAVWRNALTFAADSIDSLGDALIGRLNGVRDWFNGTYDWMRSWLDWFFNDVWQWWMPAHDQARDFAFFVIDRIVEFPRAPVDNARDWYYDHFDWAWGTWWPAARLYHLREEGTVIIQQLADRLDQLWGGAFDWVSRILTVPLDLMGNAVGNLYALISGSGWNPWSWIRANTPTVWDAWWAMWDALRWQFLDWLGRGLQTVRDWALALVNTVYPWVEAALAQLRDWTTAFVNLLLAPINGWIALVQGTIDWVTNVSYQLQAFLDDPAGFSWGFLVRGLWPRVEAWLISVWDGSEQR